MNTENIKIEHNIYEVIKRSKYPEAEKQVDGYIYSPIIGKESIWIPLGDKLNANEKKMMYQIPLDKYFTIRLDGKNFSTVIPKLKRMGILEEGYSFTFEHIMKEVSLSCTTFIRDVLYVFTQSDEITILVDKCKKDKNGNYIAREYNGRKDKILSLTSSFVSSNFVKLLIMKMISDGKSDLISSIPEITFDSRIGVYDSLKDAFELIIYRAYDCSVNGISSAIHLRSFPDKSVIQRLNSDSKLRWLSNNNLISTLTNHQLYGTLYKVNRLDINRKDIKKHKEIIKIDGPVINNVFCGVINLDDSDIKNEINISLNSLSNIQNIVNDVINDVSNFINEFKEHCNNMNENK